MSELKPCPFCGSSDVSIYMAAYGVCAKCDSTGPIVTCDSTAAKSAWNTRPSPWRSLKDEPPGSVCIIARGTPWAISHDCLEREGVQYVIRDFSRYRDALLRQLVEFGFTEWCEVPS